MTRQKRQNKATRPFNSLPVAAQIAHIRFHIGWQWTAIQLQHGRLIERSRLSMEQLIGQHYQMLADMDFLTIMARRFVRTAEQAEQIRSENQPQLKLAVRVFKSLWWGKLRAIRNALEHFDENDMFPVPMHGGGQFVFMWPGGNIDLAKLFEDARAVLRAILNVIEPLEAERDAPQA